MTLLIEIIFLILIIIILLTHIALYNLVKKLTNISNESELSGFEIAHAITTNYYQKDTHIIKKNGKYLDHFNKERNVIKLSPEVFDGTNMYASLIAMNIASETNEKDNNQNTISTFASFLILVSYILIIIGAFMNNSNVIHFGLILFIFAFVLEVAVLALNNPEIELLDYIQKENLIKPFYQDNKLYILTKIASLPYRFINYFR